MGKNAWEISGKTKGWDGMMGWEMQQPQRLGLLKGDLSRLGRKGGGDILSYCCLLLASY